MDSLAQRTTISIVQLIIGLGVLLFVPAWTIVFWQAWAYLFIFSISVVFILAYLYKNDRGLLERRLNRTEKEMNQQGIQLCIYITYIAILVIPSLDHRFLWSDVSLRAVMAGDVLVAIGYFIIFMALKENTFAATTVEVLPGHQVVSTGVYAVIRHPMYAGAMVMLLGTPLALGSWWGLIAFIPMTFFIARRLLEEEKFLSQGLSGYKEYCQKVRYHLAPLIW